jgi:hypothetical protein
MCLALVVILPAAVWVGPPRLSSVEQMVNGNPGGPTDISCPGRSQFSCHGAYAHADYSDPDDGINWQCFTLPPRIHPQRPYCATVPAAECTANFVINNCYPPGVCPKGFRMTGHRSTFCRAERGRRSGPTRFAAGDAQAFKGT